MANYLDESGLSYFWQQLKTKLAAKANLASPTFTGTPAAPTAADGTNTTQLATTAFVQTAVSSVETFGTVTGKILHVTDAESGSTVKSLTLYNSSGTEVTGKSVAITNKNLFRIDLIASSLTNKGVTFTKNSDGSISASGTSTGTYAATTCSIDKNAFVVGKTYTMYTNKTSGILYMQLALTYSDGTTDYLVSSNSPSTFTISKTVTAATGSVQITASGATVNQTVWPQIELAGSASSFAKNTYTAITYTGSNLPTLPASTANLWSNDDTVSVLEMEYYTDTASGLQEADEKTATLSMVKVDSNLGLDEANKTVVTDSDGIVSTRKLTEGYTIVNSLPSTGIDENTVYLISTNYDPSTTTPITYSLTRSGNTITLTGSNGSTTSVNGGLTTSAVEDLIDTTINDVLGVAY